MLTFRSIPMLLTLGLMVGCEPADEDGDGVPDTQEGIGPMYSDTDGDGLTMSEELSIGTDPASADTDADTLLDGEEAGVGTDPLVADTDGDTYRDGDEVAEDTDPLDPESRIYIGYWPYYPNKEDLVQNPVEGDTYKINKQFGRIKTNDQFGEVLDLYDFYNTLGKPVIFDVSAEWCPPCNDIASFLDGDDDLYGYDLDELDPALVEVRKAINRGDLYWVTVIGEQNDGSNADQATIERWYDDYPKEQIPVLLDDDYSIVDYVELPYWPTVILLDGELKPKTNDGDAITAMCEAAEMLGIATDPSMGWCP